MGENTAITSVFSRAVQKFDKHLWQPIISDKSKESEFIVGS